MSRRRPTATDWIDAAIAAGVLLVAASSVALALSATATVNFEQVNAGSVE